MNLYNYGTGVYAQTGINLINNATNAFNFSISSTNFGTYYSLVADYASINSAASAGLGIYASAASAPLIFYTGGIATGNERFRIDGSGNFIASNVVTSAPSASLANSQYQFCVYDNAGTAVFEVRYKNASGTVKVGTLALA
jgi:hypothetical protein